MNVLPRSTVALALSALGLAAARPGRFCVITGHSMSPTLHHGQVVWVEAVDPDRPDTGRGDVVLFRWQGRNYVKRIYATEGERVVMLADAGDAQPLLMPVRPGAEAWVASAVQRYGRRFRFQRLRVPPGTFYALGDCPTNSIDSRSLGPIPVRAIMGRVRPLVGRLPNVDLEMAPMRPKHGISSPRRARRKPVGAPLVGALWPGAAGIGHPQGVPLHGASPCLRRERTLTARRSASDKLPRRRRASWLLPP